MRFSISFTLRVAFFACVILQMMQFMTFRTLAVPGKTFIFFKARVFVVVIWSTIWDSNKLCFIKVIVFRNKDAMPYAIFSNQFYLIQSQDCLGSYELAKTSLMQNLFCVSRFWHNFISINHHFQHIKWVCYNVMKSHRTYLMYKSTTQL